MDYEITIIYVQKQVFEDLDPEFHQALISADDIADTQDRIRKRVLKLFARRNAILPNRKLLLSKVTHLSSETMRKASA